MGVQSQLGQYLINKPAWLPLTAWWRFIANRKDSSHTRWVVPHKSYVRSQPYTKVNALNKDLDQTGWRHHGESNRVAHHRDPFTLLTWEILPVVQNWSSTRLSNQSLHFLKLFAHYFLRRQLSLSMTHFQYTPTGWNVIVFEKRVNSAGVVRLTQGHSGVSRWIKAPFFMCTFIKPNLPSEQCWRFLKHMTIEEKDVRGLELSVWCYNTGLAEKLWKGCVKLFGTDKFPLWIFCKTGVIFLKCQ